MDLYVLGIHQCHSDHMLLLSLPLPCMLVFSCLLCLHLLCYQKYTLKDGKQDHLVVLFTYKYFLFLIQYALHL